MHRLILLFSVSTLAATQPAVAQFEVTPDHFDRPAVVQTSQSIRAQQRLRENILDEQTLLQNYTDQIAAKTQKVEELRQELISQGINGDAADLYSAAFLKEQRELQSLQASLKPVIEASREMLAGLHNDLDLLEDGATNTSVRNRSSARALEASARTRR